MTLIKKSPIETPFFFDTKKGIDHLTKTLQENSSEDWTPKQDQENKQFNQDLKANAYLSHAQNVKKIDSMDKSTYASDPKQRGKLLEMAKLQEDIEPKLFEKINNDLNKNEKKDSITKPKEKPYYLYNVVTQGLENVNDPDFGKPKKVKINKGSNPSGRDYYKEFVADKGTKLPKVSPEDEGQLSATETWDAIYKSMSPIEKGQWNNEQRKNKQRHETEKMNQETPDLTKQIIKGIEEQHKKSLKDFQTGPRFPRDQMELPFVNYKPKPKYGLHESFVNNKLYEGNIIKKLDKEIDEEI